MIYKILPVLFVGILLVTKKDFSKDSKSVKKETTAYNNSKILASNKKDIILETYSNIDTSKFDLPSYDSFVIGLEGYEKLKNQGKVKNEVLTIVDFSLSSNKERMWIIDMKEQKVILKCLVSHGMNSGKEFAKHFSNQVESNKSSLGFYITGETYQGKHGLSLKIDGQEWGVNHNARERSVVIHGADYVNRKLSRAQGFIGRSQGCPAVPMDLHKKVINEIKDQSVLYIHHPDRLSNASIL